jgi:hypothetical protein
MRYHILVAGADKSLRKMRESPSGWRIEDLLTVAKEKGLDWRGAGKAPDQADIRQAFYCAD